MCAIRDFNKDVRLLCGKVLHCMLNMIHVHVPTWPLQAVIIGSLCYDIHYYFVSVHEVMEDHTTSDNPFTQSKLPQPQKTSYHDNSSNILTSNNHSDCSC